MPRTDCSFTSEQGKSACFLLISTLIRYLIVILSDLIKFLDRSIHISGQPALFPLLYLN